MLTPLSGLLLLTALLGYPIALHPVTTALDWALMDTAHSIARLIAATDDYSALTVTSGDDTLFRSDDYDRVYYSVHSTDGRLIAGDEELKPPSRKGLTQELFYDSRIHGEQVRIAAMVLNQQSGNLTVQVAETTVKRTRLTRQILTGVIFIEILLIATAAVLIWFGVGKGLEPLQRLRAEIEARSPRDLHPVPESLSPVEVQPLTVALNKLLAQLSTMLHAQQHFVANAAHQLRTPLAGLRMQVEYALSRDDPLEWRHALAMLTPVTERTVHLVNQLLTLAKADVGGNLDTRMEILDIRRPIEDVVGQWMPQAIAKNIDFGLELEHALVQGSPFLLGEMVSNLVDNAITYSPSGGRVTVRIRCAVGETRIEVEDDGQGIPVGERENVFNRFYRLDGSGGNGCGLGLAIVQEIAQLHGARVEIRTPAGGMGTLVVVIFPQNATSAGVAGKVRERTG